MTTLFTGKTGEKDMSGLMLTGSVSRGQSAMFEKSWMVHVGTSLLVTPFIAL